MSSISFPVAIHILVLMLAACTPAGSEWSGTAGPVQAPPGAPAGTCWARNATPAIIETVTEQVLVTPAEIAPDGSITQPATYRTETRQKIVRERVESWFETPCPAQITPELTASLQRALTVRGIYHRAINGQMDARTRAALRRFQAEDGLDSATLSIESARKLGLVAVPRE